MIDEYLDLMEENNLYTGNIQAVLQQRISQDPDNKLSGPCCVTSASQNSKTTRTDHLL
ncbi:MAG: hypothetical protein R2847_06955 [Bacteroidia bacterium]